MDNYNNNPQESKQQTPQENPTASMSGYNMTENPLSGEYKPPVAENNENPQSQPPQQDYGKYYNSYQLYNENPPNYVKNEEENQKYTVSKTNMFYRAAEINGRPVYYQPSTNTYFSPVERPEEKAEYHEKKAVKKAANHIGLGLIFITVITEILVIAYQSLSGAFNLPDLLSDGGFLLFFNTLVSAIGIGGGGLLILKLQKKDISSLIARPVKGTFWPLVIGGMGVCYVANMLVSAITRIFSVSPAEIPHPAGIWGFFLSIITVAVSPAIIEEFMFRGAIMGSLLKFGKPFAIFTSAFLFGIFHGNFEQMPFAFLVGIIMGYAVCESRSIWTSVALHFANNCLAVILDYANDFFKNGIPYLISLMIYLIIIALGFLGIFVLCIRKSDAFKFKPTQHVSTAKQRFGWLCGSAAIVVFFVIEFISCMTVQFSGQLSEMLQQMAR